MKYTIIATLGLALGSSTAMAGTTCAYLLGEIEGHTVTTPGYVVVIPDSSAEVEAVRVHVDPTTQDILGYSVETQGIDQPVTDAQSIYVPGYNHEFEGGSYSLDDLDAQAFFCVEAGVMTPAIPIYIPASALQVPGVVTNVPAVTLNLLGIPVTVPGQVISRGLETIVIPGAGFTLPSQSISTPEGYLSVKVSGSIRQAAHMIPR